MDTVTLNDAQRLYVIPCGKGFSCYGYDVLFNKSEKMATWLKTYHANVPQVTEDMRGTLPLYEAWEAMLTVARNICNTEKITCDIEINQQLLPYLGRRVEVENEDGTKRRFIVGKSTGWCPALLEIPRRNSSGGMAAFSDYKSVRLVG